MGIIHPGTVRKINDRKPIKVTLPEWATDENLEPYVWVRPLSVGQREVVEKSVGVAQGNSAGLRSMVMVLACVDDGGQPVFSHDDVSWLADRAAGPVERIVEVAMGQIGKAAMDEATGN
jgi:hypothetical protein